MKYSECPNCERMVNVGKNPRIGQQVVCNRCNTKLEIYCLDPIELDWVPRIYNKEKDDRLYSNEMHWFDLDCFK
jgi:lysine biosynthesis protein LysW